MQISVELTMYPFNGDYIPPIKGFIEKLNTITGLTTQTFPTATIMMGDYDLVMDSLKMLLRWSQETHGKAVFVAKFLPNSTVLESAPN
ncbi:YkoF family thiamine/hydroxymethylpyrimidine-binding protein [Halioxenophilus sp. WMMB6]|uniref:YkoF family thiamine/hydroxymethylpyrimidine-binding protein n=1 Tax=Halioxenophilus sp. WMMB6 TaxID=3073815 RepID=UPI00295E9EC4|nr:YkoF family thiamine/hydroxymethylpyrimidine-binding protein [Halioxenophilus sp. WMMB6]